MRLIKRGKTVLATILISASVMTGAAYVSAMPAMAGPQVSSTAVEAARLALAGKFEQAGPLAQRSGDASAVRLVEMLYLRQHWQDAGYDRIVSFLNASPKWPLSETLLKRAEQALYTDGQPPKVIFDYFSKRKPETALGRLALARANLASGNQQAARALVQQVWMDADVTPELEGKILSEFAPLLSIEDHKRRMWRMVYAQSGAGAVRSAKRLGPEYQAAAVVAQSLLRGAKGADGAYKRLPATSREQLPMKYALAYFYRKASNYDQARAILIGIPGSAAAMGDPEAWWTERRIIARHSVGISHQSSAKAAYVIARNHGFTDGPEAVEGEFLAGWIALRYLKDAGTAQQHFQRLAQIAPSRTEKARAAYWLGRSLAAAGNKGAARKFYEEASQYSTVYYGQLAREQIGLGREPEHINSGQASAAAIARVNQDDVVRAMQMVADANGQSTLNIFVWSLANRFNSVDEMNAAAAVASDVGGPTLAVRLAKVAGQRNLDIDSWSYPIRALPNWPQLGPPVERALVFGLARQESEFDPNAGSKVGAQGLMQIMPATAKLIAQKFNVAYAVDKLKQPEYNVKLGAVHVGDLVRDFNGSYVLTLVAYNAGPRRSREWVAEYGDPRGGQVDAIDWVESIPFQETRQYVQKVLQNTHVYRSRLAPKTVVPMSVDLMRGTPGSVAVPTSDSTESSPCKSNSIDSLLTKCD